LRWNWEIGNREGIWKLEGQGSKVALHNQASQFAINQMDLTSEKLFSLYVFTLTANDLYG
jgi:hypothetical protein